MESKETNKPKECSSQAKRVVRFNKSRYMTTMVFAVVTAPFVGVFLALIELFVAPVKYISHMSCKWHDES